MGSRSADGRGVGDARPLNIGAVRYWQLLWWPGSPPFQRSVQQPPALGTAHHRDRGANRPPLNLPQGLALRKCCRASAVHLMALELQVPQLPQVRLAQRRLQAQAPARQPRWSSCCRAPARSRHPTVRACRHSQGPDPGAFCRATLAARTGNLAAHCDAVPTCARYPRKRNPAEPAGYDSRRNRLRYKHGAHGRPGRTAAPDTRRCPLRPFAGRDVPI